MRSCRQPNVQQPGPEYWRTAYLLAPTSVRLLTPSTPRVRASDQRSQDWCGDCRSQQLPPDAHCARVPSQSPQYDSEVVCAHPCAPDESLTRDVYPCSGRVRRGQDKLLLCRSLAPKARAGYGLDRVILPADSVRERMADGCAAKLKSSGGMKVQPVYILSAVRTPIGKFGGSLASCTAADMGEVAARAAMERAAVRPDQIEETIFGNARQAGGGPNPARQISIRSGVPQEVPAFTVNKACASGMKAIALAYQSILVGDSSCI